MQQPFSVVMLLCACAHPRFHLDYMWLFRVCLVVLMSEGLHNHQPTAIKGQAASCARRPLSSGRLLLPPLFPGRLLL
jgi:hypothetical protein